MINSINKNFLSKKKFFTDLIIDEYNYYVENISTKVMAASLPCCLYLLGLYDSLKPFNILELGSGFTSYCLRYYKKKNNLDTKIWSIDTNSQWLEKSKEYCEKRDLEIENFCLWDDFKDKEIKFDLIFVDIDSGPRRHLYFNDVFKKFSKLGTFVHLDDLHKPLVYKNLDKILKGIPHNRYDIKDLTLNIKGFTTLVEIL